LLSCFGRPSKEKKLVRSVDTHAATAHFFFFLLIPDTALRLCRTFRLPAFSIEARFFRDTSFDGPPVRLFFFFLPPPFDCMVLFFIFFLGRELVAPLEEIGRDARNWLRSGDGVSLRGPPAFLEWSFFPVFRSINPQCPAY